MPVVDLYSYRQRDANGATSDVFVYDKLPIGLQNQIINIWRRTIGWSRLRDRRGRRGRSNPGWQFIHNVVAHEHGLLVKSDDHDFAEWCEIYLLKEQKSVGYAIDLIESSFRYIDKFARELNSFDRSERGIKTPAAEAIEELNIRFRRAGVGYQYEDGQIFRIDSELIHSEVVRPALRYLHQEDFEGPRDEFLKAHAHYRAGEMKDAITDANNAFESTLKTICDQRGWEYHKGASASNLLRLVSEKGLLPSYLDNSFDQLAATLKSGLPKVRNEEGSHGQGPTLRETPDYVAAYALHLAAAKILFLAEAHKTTSCA